MPEGREHVFDIRKALHVEEIAVGIVPERLAATMLATPEGKSSTVVSMCVTGGMAIDAFFDNKPAGHVVVQAESVMMLRVSDLATLQALITTTVNQLPAADFDTWADLVEQAEQAYRDKDMSAHDLEDDVQREAEAIIREASDGQS